MERSPVPAEEAETALAEALRDGPFPLALRTALAARGLALHRVRRQLALRGINVGVTSLSYWQQGARRPRRLESLRAVRALEEILDLPAGALTRHLVTERPAPGPERPRSRPYRTLTEQAGVLDQLLSDLELPTDGGLHSVLQVDDVRIGPVRELLGRDSRHVVKAHRDGVDRYLAIHHGEEGCEPDLVVVRGHENCRVGRVRRHRGAGLVVAELLFDVRLRAGDTWMFAYGFEDGTGGRSNEYARNFSFAAAQYVMQVRFAPEALPVRCRRFTRTSAGAPRGGRTDLTVGGRHRTVHLMEESAGPGIVGIDWDWA
ncbi:hypothetical protein [Streptomyces liangshanensis]|uniref:hypothetical protein n=1 Tax=Streptomyces liangshanensis TaxID=2717324 RepID=UPI0036DDD42F